MKEEKVLHVINAVNYRQLIQNANELRITKDEVVDIKKDDDIVFLIYYR